MSWTAFSAAEAMMRGTAVVGSAIGALPEIIREGDTGFLVSQKDSEALARPILHLLRHRDLAETMGRNGYEEALVRFDKIAYMEKFISLYEQLCHRR